MKRNLEIPTQLAAVNAERKAVTNPKSPTLRKLDFLFPTFLTAKEKKNKERKKEKIPIDSWSENPAIVLKRNGGITLRSAAAMSAVVFDFVKKRTRKKNAKTPRMKKKTGERTFKYCNVNVSEPIIL